MKFAEYTPFIPADLTIIEAWTMTFKDKSRFQAAEMRFLRLILGVMRGNEVRNEGTRNQLQSVP